MIVSDNMLLFTLACIVLMAIPISSMVSTVSEKGYPNSAQLLLMFYMFVLSVPLWTIMITYYDEYERNLIVSYENYESNREK